MASYVYWIHLPEHTDIMTEGYIGVSIHPSRRLMEHKCNKFNPHLKNAFNKYENITHTILLEGYEDYCYELEAKLRPHENVGWNITRGGTKPPNTRGSKHSEETKQKIREARKYQIVTEEHRKIMSLAHKGQNCSEETRKKMSESHKGLNIWSKGKPLSEETRKRMSLAHKGKSLSEEHKRNLSVAWKKRKENVRHG